MHKQLKLLIAIFTFLASGIALAEDAGTSDRDQLKITALEALISAPPERALPRVRKVLEENNSDEVKESALFILSQIDTQEAQSLLVETARASTGELQLEAIQMIGVGGHPAALLQLTSLYEAGDADVREAVLEAYMIADDVDAVVAIARTTQNDEEFELAVEMLAAMDATEELRSLNLVDRPGMSESLIHAYIVTDDYASLKTLAMDDSDVDRQVDAIEALGIVGDEDAAPTLVEIYHGSSDPDVREAALSGLAIGDHGESVLELYRASDSKAEKSELLEYLTIMDSEAVWEIIDEALEGGQ
jgi:HEAT repeat protein